jgi:hypothetical protein
MAKYDWCVTHIPNYKEVCYVECPEDFKIDDVDDNFLFAFEKFDDKWHQLKEETQLLILTAAEIGIQTITKNNVKGWLTRLSMLQGMYGPFVYNQVPVRGLYDALNVIKELKEKYEDLPESVEALETLIEGGSKTVPIPKALDPLVLMAHIGFSIKVEKKSWQQFCSGIAQESDKMIEEEIERLRELSEKEKQENEQEVEGDS